MSALDVFTFQSDEIHVVSIDGEPWFVAGDVARTLGYRMASDMTRNLDDDERGTHVLRTPGGDQTVTIISESGLYEAILRSRIESAREFKRWVKRDVLPAIRRTGTYNAPAALSFEEMTAQVISGLQERITAAEQRAEQLEAPAAAWSGLAAADGDLTITDAAKVLGRAGIASGQRKLYDWLEVNGWIFKRGGRWQAMQSAVNAGLLVERVQDYRHPSGERRLADPQVRVTPKGLERLRDQLSPERGLAVVP